jgi:hypothetical protein
MKLYYIIEGEMWNPDEKGYVPFRSHCFTKENQDLTLKELTETFVNGRNIYVNLKELILIDKKKWDELKDWLDPYESYLIDKVPLNKLRVKMKEIEEQPEV